jgi:phage-related baseplate assembly protein
MPTLPTKSFATIVSDIAAGIQGRASKLVNFAIGSTLRAIAEGYAGVFLWFQALVLQLLTATRLATSTGVDADTFTADFMPAVGTSNGVSSPRLGAQASTGQVTFSRQTAGPSTCFIPAASAIGSNGAITNAGPNNAATVQTTDGAQNFAVTVDTTNPAYSASLGGYTLAANVASINLPVQNLVPGTSGNVAVGAIAVLTAPITGIDTVVNSAAFTNGADSESDPALKARFPLYIASLAKGTEGAIGYAVVSIKLGMQYQIWEPGIGGFTQLTVYVDDGSGAIPNAVLTAAAQAVFSVKAAGVPVAVLAATTLAANVTMTITTASGFDHPTVVAQVVAALTAYINGLGLGQVQNGALVSGTLSYMRLAQVAFNASPGVTDVTGYSLNSGTADLVPAAGQTIKSGTIIVS